MISLSLEDFLPNLGIITTVTVNNNGGANLAPPSFKFFDHHKASHFLFFEFSLTVTVTTTYLVPVALLEVGRHY